VDNIERKILQHMQRDATLSVADLAEIAGISKSACWRRIQKLEQQGVIRKRVTLMDPVALDLSLTVSAGHSSSTAWCRTFRGYWRSTAWVATWTT